MIEPLQDYTLTITHPERGNISLLIHGDCNLEDLKNTFSTIMTWMTFHSDTIKELFAEES